MPTITMMPVQGGLAAQPYTHAVRARPGRTAHPLALPATATDARLIVVQTKRGTGALWLGMQADEHPLARATNWRVAVLPGPLRTWAGAAVPPMPPIVSPGPLLFFDLVLPQLPPGSVVAQRSHAPRFAIPRRPRHAQVATPPVPALGADVSLAVAHTVAPLTLADEPPTLLARLLVLAMQAPADIDVPRTGVMGGTVPAVGAADMVDAPAVGDATTGSTVALADVCPGGPDGMTPGQVSQVAAALVHNGEVREKGVTRKLLRSLVQSRDMAMFVWLDAAGVLAPPNNTAQAAQRWRERRLLTVATVDEVIDRLRATPLPHPDQVQAAIGSLGGGL